MTAERYPTSRIDALLDGIFGVAMTLLVLDVRLAEDFHPTSAQQLLQGLVGLWPKFFPYAVSFVVLGLRWLSNVQYRPREETVSLDYCLWCLVYLLLVTCLPFSTAVIGRFSSLGDTAPDEAPGSSLASGRGHVGGRHGRSHRRGRLRFAQRAHLRLLLGAQGQPTGGRGWLAKRHHPLDP